MSLATFMECLVAQQADGTALTASTTPTSIIHPAAKTTLPAGNFFAPGKSLLVRIGGRMSNIVTTPGTLTIDVRFGSVIVWTSQALPLNVVAKTNVSWWADIDLVCRAIGQSTSANMMGIGLFTSESVIGSPANSAGGSGALFMPATAPAVGTGFDSTAAQTVDVFATWSLNNANSIQTHMYELWAKN